MNALGAAPAEHFAVHGAVCPPLLPLLETGLFLGAGLYLGWKGMKWIANGISGTRSNIQHTLAA